MARQLSSLVFLSGIIAITIKNPGPEDSRDYEIEDLISLAAVAKGAVLIERHITMDKDLVGFDHKLSLEPDEFYSLCRNIRIIEKALGKDQKTITEREWLTRKKYHVSIVAGKDIKAGDQIERKMLTVKNPGTGIQAKYIKDLLGKKARVNIPKDTLIAWEMIE